jgi:hypothetical protein
VATGIAHLHSLNLVRIQTLSAQLLKMRRERKHSAGPIRQMNGPISFYHHFSATQQLVDSGCMDSAQFALSMHTVHACCVNLVPYI